MASQITSLTLFYSTVYSGADQRKHQSSASLAFVWVIHRWPVNSSHKGPVTRKTFPFDDVIMNLWNPFFRMWHIKHPRQWSQQERELPREHWRGNSYLAFWNVIQVSHYTRKCWRSKEKLQVILIIVNRDIEIRHSILVKRLKKYRRLGCKYAGITCTKH